MPCDWMMWVESVSLGNLAWSTTQTSTPAFASMIASGDPAHLAPTMTTSCSSIRSSVGVPD